MKDYEVQEVQSGDNRLPQDGLLQTKTKYSTAVQVIRPRILKNVLNACLEEASIAGEEFFYNWSQGGKIIEGISINGALSIARNYGNCVVEPFSREDGDSFVFSASFIDLETGFNLTREFRQSKRQPTKKDGSLIYDPQRGADIVFQIGQSKAMRNVVANAVPNWLIDKVIAKAKEDVAGKIEKLGLEAARQMIIAKCNKFKIPIERVEKLHGKVKSWQIEDLVKLSGLIKGIESGQASAEDQFPADKVDEMADRVTKAKAGKQGTQTPAQQEEVAQPQSNEAKAASESPTPEQLESVNYWIKKIEDAPDSFELKILQKELQVFGGDDEKRLLAVYNVMRTKFGMGKPLESFS